ncbi:MAG: NADH-quinone oxidoreductase subunit NuoN [Legionellaceae bacterium]|nr:NADH-quinone oxidoreductase subunit NuoN [Legionellaceae bacterium]
MSELFGTLTYALPEIIILATICIALLGDLFLKPKFNSVALVCACVGLVLATVVSYLFLGQFNRVIFTGLFISDDLAQIMKIFICLSVAFSFIYSKLYLDERNMPAGDYYVLGLMSTLGMMILVSAHSLLTIYLGVELLSLPLYAMTAMRRSNGTASEAALKYFVIGSIASAMLLYGISLLYGATGNLNLHEIANSIALHWSEQSNLLAFAIVFILAGVGFKLAVVPFHMWAPDVYDGAPSAVTLFLSAAPKIAAIGMLLRLLTIGLVDLADQWQQIILIMALLSTIVGNLVAIAQTNIKRMFAYSTISHMGYALFGLLSATSAGYAASLYYVLIYAIMSVGAFGLVVLLSRTGVEIENIDDLKGLNKRSPWLAAMMMIILFSMAGMPPTVGFFAKLLVLKALIDVQMTWVAVLGLIFAVIGAFYYLRIIKVMYFEKSENLESIKLPKFAIAMYSTNCLSLLYLGIFPSALITLCVNALVN